MEVVIKRSVCAAVAGAHHTQGSGFRPTIWNLATPMILTVISGIAGWAGIGYSTMPNVTGTTSLELKGCENWLHRSMSTLHT